MRVRDLVHKDGKAGSNSSWRSHLTTCGTARQVYHYSTLMLEFDLATKEVTYVSTGHGSVSDQRGMNEMFRELDAGMYFSRAGGADIAPTSY